MNRNFEERKSTKPRITSRENKAIIKALDMYGRVPEQWELLEEIERLNNIINELEEWLYDNTNYEEYDRVEKDTFNYVIKKIEELRNEKNEYRL